MNNSSPKKISRLKAVLLSGLVFPGLGQYVQGKKALGSILMLCISICFIVVIIGLNAEVDAASARLVKSGTVELSAVFKEAHQAVENLKQGHFFLVMNMLIGIWLFSIVEIFIPRKADKNKTAE